MTHVHDRGAPWWRWPWVMLMLLALATHPARAQDDPPGRVGRLADASGSVMLFDADEGRWVDAYRNRPLTTGDRLSSGRDARAELRIGSTLLRLSESTEIELLRVDDSMVQVQLHAGTLALRVRSREMAAETQVLTREVTLTPQRAGLFRIERFGETTAVSSWRGEIRVLADSAFDVEAGRRVEMWRDGATRGLTLRWTAPIADPFAAWVAREDSNDDRSMATSYVSPEMTGIEDLDRHGRWEQHPEYGAVWFPSAVAPDWAPYRLGRWAWVRPWGWTWIEDAPWGFAPFHYGRWVAWNGRWCWTPGRIVGRPVFAPALVGWSGGWHLGLASRFDRPSAGWIPLTPIDPYRPHYRSSPGYRDRINEPWPHHERRPPGPSVGGPGVGGPSVVRPVVRPVVPVDPVVTSPPPRPDRRVAPPSTAGDGRDDGWRRTPRPPRPADPGGSSPVRAGPGQPHAPEPSPPHPRHERGQGGAPATSPPVTLPPPVQGPARPPAVQGPAPTPARPGGAHERERERQPPKDDGKSRAPEQRPGGRDRQAQT